MIFKDYWLTKSSQFNITFGSDLERIKILNDRNSMKYI